MNLELAPHRLFRRHPLAAILTLMTTAQKLSRSPELMNRDDTALLVVDVQAKLLPLIRGSGRMVWNVRRLIDGAKILGLPIARLALSVVVFAGSGERRSAIVGLATLGVILGGVVVGLAGRG